MDMKTLKGLYKTSQVLNNNVCDLQERVQDLPHYSNGLMIDEVRVRNESVIDQLNQAFKRLQWFNSMLSKSQKQALNAYKRSIKHPKQFPFDKNKFGIDN